MPTKPLKACLKMRPKPTESIHPRNKDSFTETIDSLERLFEELDEWFDAHQEVGFEISQAVEERIKDMEEMLRERKKEKFSPDPYYFIREYAKAEPLALLSNRGREIMRDARGLLEEGQADKYLPRIIKNYKVFKQVSGLHY